MREESLHFLKSWAALNKVESDKNFYKNCIFKSMHNYNDLHMSDMKESTNFTENLSVMYNLNENENSETLLKVYNRAEWWVQMTLLRQKKIILKLKSSSRSSVKSQQRVSSERKPFKQWEHQFTAVTDNWSRDQKI